MKYTSYHQHILLLLTLTLIACGGKKSADSANADSQNGLVTFHLNAPPSTVEPLLLSEIADSVSYVALETTKETLTKDGVQYGDRFYTIVNKNIFCFDNNGYLLHQVGKCGQGPEEYMWPSNDNRKVRVDITTNWVYCYSSGRIIIVYDENGRYVKSLTGKDYTIMSLVYNKDACIYTRDSIYIIDTRTDKIKCINRVSSQVIQYWNAQDEKYKEINGYAAPGLGGVTYTSKDAFFMWNVLCSDTVFEAYNNEIRPYCLFSPENKYVYADFYEDTEEEMLHQPLILRMHVLKNKILLYIRYYTSIENKTNYWMLCDMKTGKTTYYADYIVNDLDGGPNILVPNSGNEDINCLSVEDLKNDTEIYNSYFTEGVKAKLKDQEGKFQRLLEPLSDDANPIIRTFYWKE